MPESGTQHALPLAASYISYVTSMGLHLATVHTVVCLCTSLYSVLLAKRVVQELQEGIELDGNLPLQGVGLWNLDANPAAGRSND